MSLNVPLSVLLESSRATRDITNLVRGLSFRHVIPGGFANIQTAFDAPLAVRPGEIDYYAKMTVFDNNTGETVAQGRIGIPERSAGDAGEIWGLTAIGPSAHASDQMGPYIALDAAAESWTRIPNSSTFLTAENDSQSTAPGWRLQFDRGKVVGVADHGGIEYKLIAEAGQKLARIAYSYVAGTTDSNWRHQIDAVNGGTTTASDVGFTTVASSTFKIVATHWPNGRTYPQIRIARNNTSITVADDVTNVWLTNIVVRALLLAADGTERLPTGSATLDYAYSSDTILAEDVVRDVLGRLLPLYDGANAKIAASTVNIGHLAYINGIDPAGIFGDLMLIEPKTYWAAWEANSAGKHRFEWSVWDDTVVDLDTSIVDGFDSPGSAVDFYDRVKTRYKGAKGASRYSTRTQLVPQLAAAGITRTKLIDLGDEAGGAANADQVGDNFLAEHLYPPNRGRLVVRRPILSHKLGRMIPPHRIRPGTLIRALDVSSSVDALNRTDRDGATVFRVVATEFDTDANAATLELDSYAPSAARQIADIQKNPALSRRRN